MLQGGLPLSRDVIYHHLQVCYKKRDLAGGRLLHSLMIMGELNRLAALGDHLIRLFAACGGTLLESSLVFCTISDPDSFTWQAFIFAHTLMGQHALALQLSVNMQESGIAPCEFMLSSVLKACSSLGSLRHGRLIHDYMVTVGFDCNSVLGSSLLDMYGKCGCPSEARAVFDALPSKNAVAFSAMMSAYVQFDMGFLALQLFEDMQERVDVKLDEVSYLFALKACTCTQSSRLGRLIHERILKEGLLLNEAMGNALLDMYVKCGSLDEAHNTFIRLSTRNIVSYGTILAGYAQNVHWISATELLKELLHEGKTPNEVIFLSLVKACSTREAEHSGRCIHSQIIENGLEESLVIGSALIRMYGRYGMITDAYRVFLRLPEWDAVAWEVIMSGLLGQGVSISPLDIFGEMQGKGINQDRVILLSGMKACGRSKNVSDGQIIHNVLVENGFEGSTAINNAILDMYLRCGMVDDALQVHDSHESRDVVTWNTAIAGCMLKVHDLSPIEIFTTMQQDQVTPDMVTFTLLLQRYGNLRALEAGKQIFDFMVKSGCEVDLVTGTALIYMFAKSGYLDDALWVLCTLQEQDVVSWNAIIVGYIQQGNFLLAMKCVRDLEKQGLQLNVSSCTSIIASCSHIGALEEGLQFLRFMRDHGMSPQIEHVNSMIDLLGRSGCLTEAKKLISEITGLADIVSWRSLLTSCKTYGNFDLARQCVCQLDILNADINNMPNIANVGLDFL
ncbi:hypothetical protein KP509_05G054800 [Ceratopteris richardii]|uniref:Pentatricopeptide repeat-containing protein n=1 Tax=Ceratopteris richardii TaxID=49495 RepID=A0A8T2UT55_CERRI|nr:hypothetical protein KP509_05G054800 [Ceratopteris richardii]